jgi:hypothetical protein
VLQIILSFLVAIRVFFRSRSDTALEVLALRQQIAVLKRKRLDATGEGQTNPPGVDGKLADSTSIHPAPRVTVTVGGIPKFVRYAGGAPGEVAGLMQINMQIPGGVQRGVLQVGTATSTPDAVWIAVSGK